MTDEEKQAKIAALRALSPTETQTKIFIECAIKRLEAGDEKPAASAKTDAENLMKVPEVQRSAYKVCLILGETEADAKALAAALLPEAKTVAVK